MTRRAIAAFMLPDGTPILLSAVQDSPWPEHSRVTYLENGYQAVVATARVVRYLPPETPVEFELPTG